MISEKRDLTICEIQTPESESHLDSKLYYEIS